MYGSDILNTALESILQATLRTGTDNILLEESKSAYEAGCPDVKDLVSLVLNEIITKITNGQHPVYQNREGELSLFALI